MQSIICKKCHSSKTVKNGVVRNKQRYHCKECLHNFVSGDERVNPTTQTKRALTVILYSLGKVSYGMLAKLFNVSRTTIQNWIEIEADLLHDPIIVDNITEIEFDEMWHFLHQKKTNIGYLKHMIEHQRELSHGLQAVVMHILSKNYNSSTTLQPSYSTALDLCA